MPQGSFKSRKCDVPKQKDKHKRKLSGLKKGGNLCLTKICHEYCDNMPSRPLASTMTLTPFTGHTSYNCRFLVEERRRQEEGFAKL